MKLIYITNARMPTERAHGIQIMHMCAALARTGADVTLLVPARRNEIKEDIFSYYGLEKNFRIVFLSCVDFLWLRWMEPLFYYVELFSFLCAVRVYLWMHAYDALFTRELWMVACVQRVVYEAHTLSERVRRIETWLLRRAHKIIAITHALAREIGQRNVEHERVHVLPDGVVVAQFAPRTDFDKAATRVRLFGETKKTVVVYTGSYFLYPWKGVDTLLAASAKLRDTHEFFLIGGCSEEIEEGARRKQEQHLTNITFVPRVPHARVPEYVQAADVVVLPNSGAYHMSRLHTSPLKLFEYMASGTPIVASDLPSLREVIDEHRALLVTPDDADALAQALQYAATHPEGMRALARVAAATVVVYDWDRRACALAALLV